jgi:hypothetical protein
MAPDGYLTRDEALDRLLKVTTRKAAWSMLASPLSGRIADPQNRLRWLYPADVIDETCAQLGGHGSGPPR